MNNNLSKLPTLLLLLYLLNYSSLAFSILQTQQKSSSIPSCLNNKATLAPIHVSVKKNYYDKNYFQILKNRFHYGVMQDLIPPNKSGNNVLQLQQSSKPFLAGNFLAWVRYMTFASTDAYQRGFYEMMKVFDWKDIWTICVFVFGVPRLMKLVHERTIAKANKAKSKKGEVPLSYQDSRTFTVARVIQDFGKIGGLVYGLELLAEFIDGMVSHRLHIVKGFALEESFFTGLPQMIAITVYGFWAARSLSVWKRKIITHYLRDESNFSIGAQFRDRKALIPLYDRFCTAFIYILYAVYVVDISPLNLSYIARSIVTLGGISSFVVGLALQGPAKQLISGIILLLSGKFHTGEKIKFDSTVGKVVNIGWTDTTIQGSDLVSFRIPNEKLISTNISNISRTQSCYAKITLDIDIEEIHNVRNIIDEMTKEIDKCLPNSSFMISDQNAVEVLWTDIENAVIKISVKCHLRCKPSSVRYHQDRQKILFAIGRAVETTGTKFAVMDYN